MLVTFFSTTCFYIQSVISGGFVQFVVVCLVSLSCIGISGYLVVLTPIEKSFCVESLDSDYVLWMQALSFNYKFTFLYNSICDVSDTYENISDGKFYFTFYSLLSVGSVWLYNIDSVWTFETITIFLWYIYILF